MTYVLGPGKERVRLDGAYSVSFFFSLLPSSAAQGLFPPTPHPLCAAAN